MNSLEVVLNFLKLKFSTAIFRYCSFFIFLAQLEFIGKIKVDWWWDTRVEIRQCNFQCYPFFPELSLTRIYLYTIPINQVSRAPVFISSSIRARTFRVFQYYYFFWLSRFENTKYQILNLKQLYRYLILDSVSAIPLLGSSFAFEYPILELELGIRF